MLSRVAALALFATAVVGLVAVPAAAQQIDWNCPSVGPNAIIRLKPCSDPTKHVVACFSDLCGGGQSENVVYATRPTGANEGFAEWRIQLSTENPGWIRLTNMGTGSTGNFLVANAEQSFNGVTSRATKSMSYADDPKQSVWRWDLRANRRACRVMLTNQLANKRLGRPNEKWPKINNLEVPGSSYGPTEEVTNDIYEVEFVRMATAAAAPPAAKAPAPAPQPAPAPAPQPAPAPAPQPAPAPAPQPAPAPAPNAGFTNTAGGAVANGNVAPNGGWGGTPAPAPAGGDDFDLSDLFPGA